MLFSAYVYLTFRCLLAIVQMLLFIITVQRKCDLSVMMLRDTSTYYYNRRENDESVKYYGPLMHPPPRPQQKSMIIKM